MKKNQIIIKAACLSWMLFVVVPIAEAQGVMQALQTGDQAPDLVFRKMINYPDSAARLSDFKGKAVILDFWATYCVPCVASFPKLEKLQKEFHDELKVILLSNYNKKGIEDFYRNKTGLSLPTNYYDHKTDVFDKLFPHREIPHYVWIERTGKIYAITGGEEVNEANVRAFLQGQRSGLTLKDDALKWGNHSGTVLDSIESDGKVNEISVNPRIAFQSMIMRYDPRLTTLLHEGVEKNRHKFLALQNFPVANMMFFALGYNSSHDHWRFYIDLKDSTLASPRGLSGSAMDQWRSDHYYTYRIILDRPDSAHLHQRMLDDLRWQFGIRAYPQKLKLPYLALCRTGEISGLRPVRTDTSSLATSIYNIRLQNKPVSTLLETLFRYRVGKDLAEKKQYQIAMIDETGIRSNIDLDIKGISITDIDALNRELAKHGLELRKKEGFLDMIVITDK